MNFPVMMQLLRERRRSLMAWSLSLSGIAFFYAALYPSIRDTGFEDVTENLPEFMTEMFSLDEIGTPEGYLNGELFTLTGPLLLLIFAIGLATDTTAGEEERGTLDLLMAHPVTRRSVVVQKGAGLLAGLGIIEVTLLVTLLVSSPLFGLDVPAVKVVAALVSQFLLAAAFGLFALALGATSGNKGLSRGVSAGAAVLAYLLSALAPISDAVEPWRVLSPVYHGAGYEPLFNGLGWSHVAVLVALTACGAAAAAFGFDRREITV